MLVVPDFIILNCFFCCSVNSLSFFVLLNKGQNILYSLISGEYNFDSFFFLLLLFTVIFGAYLI